MIRFPALTARPAQRVIIADPEAGAAYHALEEAIAIASGSPSSPDVRALTASVLRAYARALVAFEVGRRPLAWAAFIRSAALLYFAIDRPRERRADPRWLRAAQTLRAIVLENADLIPCSIRMHPPQELLRSRFRARAERDARRGTAALVAGS